ncbi:MAG: peptidase M16 [Candidatus Tectimicrobiota bacterium]|nr:MAG: peptidase M16 [Candidatus Tectomicrobia bacterium]
MPTGVHPAPRAETMTLANGLQVVLLEDHSAPVVALQTWVRFGSADEEARVAGIAHVFEHMLFKGTERFPHGEIAALIEGAGGVVNAWTSYDETVYHVTIASRFWQTGFDVLSDAVLHSLFDPTELEREKEVVLEELRRGKDNPDREVTERLFALAFTTHPYRRPIIGFADTVRRLTRQDMLEIFTTWYAPNNMILVAVGDFDRGALQQAIAERFGGAPARSLPPRPRPAEPPQTAPRALAFAFPAELARVEIAFPSVAAADPLAPALDLLSDVLGSGYNSVLFTELKRRQELAHEVYAYNYTPLDPGLFVLGASCLPEQVPQVVRTLMRQAHQPALALSDHELTAAKTRLISHFVHARETYQGIADQLGRFARVYDDPNYDQRYIAAVEALTRDDLQQAAAAVLAPQRANVAVLMPSGSSLPAADTVLAWAQGDTRGRRFAVSGRAAAAEVTVVPLPGGARLLVQTDRKAPLVSIRTLLDGGQRAEPAGKEGLAQLLAAVWDRGTSVYSAAEVEREVDRLGATLNASSDRDSVQLSARFLKETFADGLALYFDVLTDPAFPDKEVERERSDQLRELDSLQENRFRFAMQYFLQTFYGKHPYNHLSVGLPEGLSAVSRDDLLLFHRAHLRPDRLVIAVVGDVTADEVLALLERLAPPRLFTDMAVTLPPPPPVPQRAELVERILEVEGQQTHIVWGFPTVTVRHPDRYSLHVLDTVLGGMGGRLFVELRDKKSLAYVVTSFDAYPVDPGFLVLYIGCSPEKEAEALQAFEQVLRDVQENGVTAAELERAKTYLEGVLDISLQATSQRTAVYGLGELQLGKWDAFRDYRRAIQEVTAAEVQRVAQTYLDPARSVRVIVRAKGAGA